MAKSLEPHRDGISMGIESGKHPILKGYEFRNKIGHGGFGTVWHFFDPRNGRDVAVKRLSVIESMDEKTMKTIEAFEKEIQLLKSLHHPRIVQYYECFENNGSLDLVMEYVAGGTLKEILPLLENVARKFVFQILEALEYLHSNKIVHKDIKCANILRDTAGNVKLSDFGISDRIATFTKYEMTSLSGTMHFIAPELFGEDQKTTPKIDICIARIIRNHMAYVLPENVSMEAKNFIKKLLESDTSRRPTVQEAFDLPYMSEISITMGLACKETTIGTRTRSYSPRTSFQKTNELLKKLNVEAGGIYGNLIVDKEKKKMLVHYVAEKEIVEVLKEVLQEKCNLEIGADGREQMKSAKPIHFAAVNGSIECLLLLIKAGANVNAKEIDGYTALHVASIKGFVGCVKALIEAGADINAKENIYGSTALHLAAKNGKVDCMKALIEAGSYQNAKSKDGYTALHWAAYDGFVDCVKVLIKAGVDVNAKENSVSCTALHVAAKYAKVDCVKALIKAGADVNAKEIDGYTALHVASIKGFVGCVKALIEAGANLNAKENIYGSTALHWAARNGFIGCVKALLEAGADRNAKSKDGYTALHWTAYNGYADCMKALIKAGANLNVKDNSVGCTALHVAASYDKVDCVKALIKAGADVNLKNIKGETALEVAENEKQLKCVKYMNTVMK